MKTYPTKIHRISEEGPLENHIWRYELNFPQKLHEWDVWSYWERESIESIASELKRGDILFDVGTESGALAALYAKYIVGGDSLVLFEPAPHYWPMIKGIFEANELDHPLAYFNGFAAESSSKDAKISREWPKPTRKPSGNSYRYLHNIDDYSATPRITIDNFVSKSKIKPAGVVIDVEGAELRVLRGMKKTLKTVRPKLWVSVHKDLMERDYNPDTVDELLAFMREVDYTGKFLAVDHEAHWFFSPN